MSTRSVRAKRDARIAAMSPEQRAAYEKIRAKELARRANLAQQEIEDRAFNAACAHRASGVPSAVWAPISRGPWS